MPFIRIASSSCPQISDQWQLNNELVMMSGAGMDRLRQDAMLLACE